MKTYKLFISLLLVLALVGGASTAFSAETSDPKILTIASGPIRGSWYPMGGVFADIVSKNVGVKITVDIGGGVENVKRINSGADAQIGFAMTPALLDGWKGNFPFKKPHQNVRLITYMTGMYVQFVALKKSGITSWGDLQGKRFSPGNKGLGVEVLTQLILKEMGQSYDSINKSGGKVLFFSRSEAISAMRDGRLDANVVTAIYPHPSFEELQLTRDLVIVPIDTKIRAQVIEKYPAYSAFELPANTYKGQTNSVPTLTYSTVLIVNKDLSEDLVYKITKSLFEQIDKMQAVTKGLKKDFSLKSALSWKGIPHHPGAIKYFKEAGIWK